MMPLPNWRQEDSFWADFRRGFVTGFTTTLKRGAPVLAGFVLGISVPRRVVTPGSLNG